MDGKAPPRLRRHVVRGVCPWPRPRASGGREKKAAATWRGKADNAVITLVRAPSDVPSEWPDGCQLGSLARASPTSLPPPSKPLPSRPVQPIPGLPTRLNPSRAVAAPRPVQCSTALPFCTRTSSPPALSCLCLPASCLPTSLDCQFHAQRLDQVPSTTRPATGNIERIFGPIIAVSKCLFCGEAIANCRGREAAQGQFNCRPPLLVDFS